MKAAGDCSQTQKFIEHFPVRSVSPNGVLVKEPSGARIMSSLWTCFSQFSRGTQCTVIELSSTQKEQIQTARDKQKRKTNNDKSRGRDGQMRFVRGSEDGQSRRGEQVFRQKRRDKERYKEREQIVEENKIGRSAQGK